MKILSILITLFSLISCSNLSIDTKPGIIGVYKAIDRDCNGSEPKLAACKDLQLIEFVYGNFYQISEDQIAFVIWSGEKDKELLYAAKKVDVDPILLKFPTQRELSSDDFFHESVVFSNIDSLEYSFGNSNNVSKIYFQRLMADEIGGFFKEYPGSE